ncbi:HEPN domain-containing protein [Saccharomonospora halophila]|uniref:HEPN domain-containing protein n=1 Tax=Saccharomonospora halophila TaxID=129922 RepID=UPI0038CD3560
MPKTTLPGLDETTVGLDSVLHTSQRYLASAYDSVSGLIETTYPILRESRPASRGRLTDTEQDIFRAAVVFSGAAIDTVFKEALRNCLAIQVEASESARDKYIQFVMKYIQDGPNLDTKNVAILLASRESSDILTRAYVESLTNSSLQSRNQVEQSLSALGLKGEKDLYIDAKRLDPLFRARNNIAHEMDMTPSSARGQGKRSRRERIISEYVDMCHTGLNYCQRMLNRLQSTLYFPE